MLPEVTVGSVSVLVYPVVVSFTRVRPEEVSLLCRRRGCMHVSVSLRPEATSESKKQCKYRHRTNQRRAFESFERDTQHIKVLCQFEVAFVWRRRQQCPVISPESNSVSSSHNHNQNLEKHISGQFSRSSDRPRMDCPYFFWPFPLPLVVFQMSYSCA